jgi:lipoprotein-releasing system ATP-binding protein
MIKLQDVTKTYEPAGGDPVTAVQGASLSVTCGEFVVVTGRSGSGKTTLLNLAAGLTRPTSGSVFLAGQDLWRLPDREQARLRNQKVGFVFQFPSLLPALTVLENVTLPVIFGGRGQSEGVAARAKELLERVGLAAKLYALPRQLSAGQQQRVVVARALINRPEILLADEPTSDLDEQTETEIMELFRDIHTGTGVTILMVTHTSQLVRYGTRAIQMAGGQVLNGRAAAEAGTGAGE